MQDVYIKKLADLPITFLCIHGNHELRPETIGSYELTTWNGGKVYAFGINK